jgi:hypothetical protein
LSEESGGNRTARAIRYFSTDGEARGKEFLGFAQDHAHLSAKV